jgi:arylsulfatase A-like enzyme
MRLVLYIVSALVLALTIAIDAARAAGEKDSATAQRPNIVFILADDLGWGDVGCYGQTKIKTPNIDRMAVDGIRFTQAYAGAPVCAPSRSVLMTGQNTGHTRVRGNNCFAGGLVQGKNRRANLTDQDVTVGNVLQKAGYRTCLIGKWHLEGYDPKASPLDRGFDEFYGWLLTEPGTHDPAYYPARCVVNRQVIDVPGNENGKKGIYETNLYTRYASKFIRRNNDKPFFLYFCASAPHDPLVAPPDLKPYAKEPWDESMKIYAAMVTRLDGAVGQIRDLLRELKIADNTIVIFTSDNGPRSRPTAELTRVAEFFHSNGPLQGYKRDMYEGGIREPALACWPGLIPAGAINDAPWYFADYMPTLSEFAGGTVPANIDGISVAPLFLGKIKQIPERFLYWEFYERGFEQAVQWGQWKAVRHKPGGPLELYKLPDDIGESKNIAAQNPDVAAKIEAYLKTARTDSPEFPINHGQNAGKKNSGD